MCQQLIVEIANKTVNWHKYYNFHPYSTLILPLFHTYSNLILPLFYPYSTHILPLFYPIHQYPKTMSGHSMNGRRWPPLLRLYATLLTPLSPIFPQELPELRDRGAEGPREVSTSVSN